MTTDDDSRTIGRRYAPRENSTEFKPANTGIGRKANVFNEDGLKACSKCGAMKSKDEYYVARSMASGYASRCIPCCREANKKSVEKHGRPARKDRSKHPVIDGRKICIDCKLNLPVDSFEWRKKWGYINRCRDCKAIADEKYAIDQRLRSNGYALDRKYRLKGKYNLTPEEYDAMLLEQNGACAICKALPGSSKNGVLHVDHCHETGKVRGLLCDSCNLTLGRFNDSAERFIAAAIYLEKHS